jgi:hypothetical protein
MYKNRTMKPVEIVLRRWEGIRRNIRGYGFIQVTLYAYMEIS